MLPFADGFPAANIQHHFTGGVYAKELHIPAGYRLVTHSHPHEHLSILASGTVTWTSGDDVARVLVGPCAVVVDADTEHALQAETDAVWFCIHATDETDVDKVDAVVLAQGES